MAFRNIPPLLREGLHADWLGQVTQYMAAEAPDLEPYLTEASRNTVPDFTTRSTEAARYILMFVPFRLQARIDSADMLDPPRMLARLEKEAGPFDLFGLPRELRDNVYEFIPEFQDDRTIVFNGLFGGRQSALPASTRASRELRNETRAMFIKRANFDFNFVSDTIMTVGHVEIPYRLLESWFRDVIGEAAEHLRCVQLSWESIVSNGFLVDSFCMDYDNNKGLSYSSQVPEDSYLYDELERQAIAVQKQTEVKKGQAIVKTLLTGLERHEEFVQGMKAQGYVPN